MISNYTFRPIIQAKSIQFCGEKINLDQFKVTTHYSFDETFTEKDFEEVNKQVHYEQAKIDAPTEKRPLKICKYQDKIVGFLTYGKNPRKNAVFIGNINNLSIDYIFHTKKFKLPKGIGISLLKDFLENTPIVNDDTEIMALSFEPEPLRFFNKFGITHDGSTTARYAKQKIKEYLDQKT